MTAEERKVLNCRVVQTFDVLQTAALNEKKHKLKQQGDMKERLERKPLTGGVVSTSASARGTMNKIVYEDMRVETLTTQQLLERVTFFEDPRRRTRLQELERQANEAQDWPLQGPARVTAQRKRRRRNRSKLREISKQKLAPFRNPCGNLKNGQNSEGFLPPTGFSWTRPGLYPDVAPHTPTPRGESTECPGGPGLPNGDATGDDD